MNIFHILKVTFIPAVLLLVGAVGIDLMRTGSYSMFVVGALIVLPDLAAAVWYLKYLYKKVATRVSRG